MLGVHLLGAPTIGDMIEDNLQDLDLGIVKPGSTLIIEPDMRCDCCGWHDGNLAGLVMPDNKSRFLVRALSKPVALLHCAPS
jgi:hypothetical protein